MNLQRLGPYQLERVLGQGGMGTVYAATDQESGTRAAVKVLAPALAVKGNFRARFASEIETLKRLRHPHIVQLLGYGEHDQQLFYAMELVPGRSLQDELRGGRIFTVDEVIQYGIEIASALKLAHDSGVIHRDLKPANLLLGPDGHLKLTDFGIAKLFGGTQLTADGGIVGTVDFMAPEQAEGKPVTARSDLYSLGSVLYALLARRPPFTGRSAPQVIHALRYESAVPLRRMAPDVPEELEAIVHQLMEKDPAQRIATATIVGNRLKALQHGLAARRTPRSDSGGAAERSAEFPLDGGLTTDLPSSSDLAPLAESSDLTWDSMLEAAPAAPVDIDRVGATQVESRAGGPPSALRHFTTVAEEERSRALRERHERRAHRSVALLQIGFFFLLALFLGLAAWFWWRPPTADELYAAIDAGAADEQGGGLAAVESQIGRFLELYPNDPRRDEVARYQETLRRELEQRRFRRRTRHVEDAAALTTVERLYAEAMQVAVTQPEIAVERLTAIVQTLGDDGSVDETTRRTLELARHQLDQLRKVVERQQADDLHWAHRRLDWADEQRAKDPEAAQRVYQGLVVLYRDRPWAEEIVERARKASSAP